MTRVRDWAMSLCIAAVGCVCATQVDALPLEARLSQLALDTYSSATGLPFDGANDAAQTPDGYLWFATNLGLMRFDGFRTVETGPAQSPLFKSAAIATLRVDPEGSLWVGTNSGAVRRRPDGTWVAVPEIDEKRHVQDIALGHDGTVWFALDNGVVGLRDGKRVDIGRREGLDDDNALFVFEDGRHRLWITTAEGSLHLWDGTRARPIPLPEHVVLPVFAVIEDRAGQLWIGHNNGIDRFDGVGSVEPYVKRPSISQMMIDHDGTIWAANPGAGLLRVNPKLEKHAELLTPSEAGRMAFFVFEDREGSIWFGGTTPGIYRVRPTPLLPLGPSEGWPIEGVRSVAWSHDELWATTNIGLVVGDPRRAPRETYTTKHGLPGMQVNAIAFDATNTAWIATSHGLVSLTDGKFVAHALDGESMRCVLVDRRQRIWVGTSDGAWVRERAGLPFRKLGKVGMLAQLLERHDGSIVATGTAGVFSIDEQRIARLPQTIVENLDSGGIWEASDGSLYVGTNGNGIVRLRGDETARLTTADGLPDDTIAGITAGKDEQLWLSTARGLVAVSRAALDAGFDGRSRVDARLYDRRDGLRGADCGAGLGTPGTRTPDGRLVFACSGGAVEVPVLPVGRNAIAPLPIIERMLIDGVLARQAFIPAGTTRFDLEFSSSALRVPSRARFRYRLVGYDRDWIDADQQRAARYTSPPPGQYRFEVNARNDDGVWSTSPATLMLEVEPRLWQRTGVQLIALLLLGLLAGGGYRARVRWLLEQKRRLEALVAQRTVELEARQAALVRAEKLASIGTLVRGIAHELNNPVGFMVANLPPLLRYVDFLTATATKLGDGRARTPDELAALLRFSPKKDLEFVVRDLRRLLDDLREGGRRIDLIVGDLQRLTTGEQRPIERVELARAAEVTRAILLPRLAEGATLQLDVAPDLAVDARAGEIEQILLNLADNAVRAIRPGGHVTISGVRDGDAIVLTVRDDGVGMTDAVRRAALEPFFSTRAAGEGSGLGLTIVASLVEHNRGQLTIVSEPERGTRVEVRLPA